MAFIVVIPARYASSRLPVKLLANINGKPLIQYTWQQAEKSGAKRVIIATDHDEIARIATDFGAEVCLTANYHQSGTDRIAEVVNKMGFTPDDVVVNLQGDEPLMPASYLKIVADKLSQSSDAVMATLATPVSTKTLADLDSPDVVKVVIDKNQNALYFSRSAVPCLRQSVGDFKWLRHLGVYAYRAHFLVEYCNLAPSALEQIESLEQLRVLWHGYTISVQVVTHMPGPGVDNIHDLEKVSRLLS